MLLFNWRHFWSYFRMCLYRDHSCLWFLAFKKAAVPYMKYSFSFTLVGRHVWQWTAYYVKWRCFPPITFKAVLPYFLEASAKLSAWNLRRQWFSQILISEPQISHAIGKVIPIQAVETLRVVRGWGSHIYRHFSSQMAARLSTLHASRFLLPGRFLVLNSVRGWVDPRAIVCLEGLGKLKKSTSSWNRTGDLPACSIVPQPTTLPCAPIMCHRFV
jgi:hypothetical protein